MGNETLTKLVLTVAPMVLAAVGYLGRRWYVAEGPLWTTLRHQEGELAELREQLGVLQSELASLRVALNDERDKVALYRRELIMAGIDIPSSQQHNQG